jgi:Na+/H+ antiporter NhaD/arsenite permease-like protein
LIVLTHEHVPGHLFAARMVAAWIAAVAATVAVLLAVYRNRLTDDVDAAVERVRVRLGFGTVGVLSAAVLVLVLHQTLGRWSTAGVAAGGSVLINNLPAAVVLSAHAPAHPRALQVGLDLGPNLAVTGSLSALLWIQVARSIGARPSARRYTQLGIVIAPITMALALLALRLFVPSGF